MIDWFTVGAQLINFLILVWLMKRYLYQPILHAIDAREKRIAAELADAATKQAEAEKVRNEYQKKHDGFEQQRAALLSKATDEAADERKRLLDETRKAADALSTKRYEALTREAQALTTALSHRSQHEVFSIARKTLTDLAESTLEARMAIVFSQRIRSLNGPSKEKLAAGLHALTDPATVRSAFDLPFDARATVQRAINETFSANIRLRFETDADLISGIELTLNGQKVAWSIADYLKSMETRVTELLNKTPQPATQEP